MLNSCQQLRHGTVARENPTALQTAQDLSHPRGVPRIAGFSPQHPGEYADCFDQIALLERANGPRLRQGINEGGPETLSASDEQDVAFVKIPVIGAPLMESG